MRIKLSDIRSELPPLVHLALPLIAGELGWVSMSLVDTVMLGHLPNSALAMSAAALAQVLFNTLCFGVGGVLLGLDTLISQALGAKEQHEANRWLLHGVVMAVALSALLIADLRRDAGPAAAPAGGPGDSCAGCARHAGAELRDAPAAVVLHLPPLPAGRAPWTPDCVRADLRKPGECGGRLGADLWTPLADRRA